MFSSEGEKVSLSQSISTSAARGAVEKWLLQVQDVMAMSVKDVTEQARDVSGPKVTESNMCTVCTYRYRQDTCALYTHLRTYHVLKCSLLYRRMQWTLVSSGYVSGLVRW